MTNNTTLYELQGTMKLDGKFYEIVRPTSQGQPPSELGLTEEYGEEPPWSKGAPALVSEPQYTWHLGGLKSRQGVVGTTEYGQNTDTRWAFRMLPASKINALFPPASTAPVTSMFEALGYIFCCAGPNVYRINPATDAVTLSKNFGAENAIMGLRWENDFGLVCTTAATNSLWKVTAIGSPDTWTQTADVEAYALAASANRLFKITANGEVKNIVTSLDPMVDANWADSVQIGEKTTVTTALLAYERTVFAGKGEGLFGIGENGFGIPLIKRMVRELSNCYGMTLMDPYVLVPHVRGLYRYSPGNVESVGLEKELLNESPVKGRWLAFAIDGDWIYGSLFVTGIGTYIMVGREKRAGETGFSPIIWDTLLFISGSCYSMWLSSLSTRPRLYFNNGFNVGYIELTDGPGSYEYALNGVRYSNRLKFDDWNPKDFSYIDLVGKNLSSSKYWVVSYSIDGAPFLDLDINGVQMKLSTTGKQRFFLPVTAVGREIQFAFTYTSNSASTPPELNYIEAFAVPQSKKIPLFSVFVQLEEGIRHGQGHETRPALTQLNDLIALSESATPVLATGPWSATETTVHVKKARVAKEVQTGNRPTTRIVELAIQLREQS